MSSCPDPAVEIEVEVLRVSSASNDVRVGGDDTCKGVPFLANTASSNFGETAAPLCAPRARGLPAGSRAA
jgi:hypothetical protein